MSAASSDGKTDKFAILSTLKSVPPVYTQGHATLFELTNDELEMLVAMHLAEDEDDPFYRRQSLFDNADFLALINEYMAYRHPKPRAGDVANMSFESFPYPQWCIYDGSAWIPLSESENEGVPVLPDQFNYPVYPLDYWVIPGGPYDGGEGPVVTLALPADAKLVLAPVPTYSTALGSDDLSVVYSNGFTYMWNNLKLHFWDHPFRNGNPVTAKVEQIVAKLGTIVEGHYDIRRGYILIRLSR